jgi:hypothetical protein
MAPAYMNLAFEDASYISGQVIQVMEVKLYEADIYYITSLF